MNPGGSMKNKYLSMVLLSAIMASFILPLLIFGSSANAGSTLSFRTAPAFRGILINVTTTVAPTVTKSYSPAFQNGSIVTLVTYSNNTCAPSLNSLYPNSTETTNALGFTNCEVGTIVNRTSTDMPRWNLIPSFTGLSVYGIASWGATPQGYPTYNGMTIATQCGASGTASGCFNKTSYFYSPKQSAIEKSIGIYNGINGLPEGVLPNPANDKILPSNKTGTPTISYLVRVAVYDPNIFPNATTGKCKQVAPSNLSNPTGDCLTSLSALKAAFVTTDNAIPTINSNNPLYQAAGKPMTQVVLVGGLGAISLNASNTNLLSDSYMNSTPSYPKVVTTTIPTVATTTIAATTIAASTTILQQAASTTVPQSAATGGSNTMLYLGIAVVVVIIVVAAWTMSKKKK
jgi:hypothetical protein